MKDFESKSGSLGSGQSSFPNEIFPSTRLETGPRVHNVKNVWILQHFAFLLLFQAMPKEALNLPHEDFLVAGVNGLPRRGVERQHEVVVPEALGEVSHRANGCGAVKRIVRRLAVQSLAGGLSGGRVSQSDYAEPGSDLEER